MHVTYSELVDGQPVRRQFGDLATALGSLCAEIAAGTTQPIELWMGGCLLVSGEGLRALSAHWRRQADREAVIAAAVKRVERRMYRPLRAALTEDAVYVE